MRSYENYSMSKLSTTTIQSIVYQSAWNDVMNAAKSAVLDGKVQIIRNTPNLVTGTCESDSHPGTYHKCAISRHDPDSQVIEQWVCDCPWHQFAFQRTRQWKKLEGRVCHHVMALYMQGRSTPLDVKYEAPGYQPGKGQRQSPAGPGQMEMPFDQQVEEQGLTPDEEVEMQKQDTLEKPQVQEGNQPEPITPMREDAIPQMPPVPEGNPPVKVWANPPSPSPPSPVYEQMSLWDATIPNVGGPGLPPLNPVSIPGGRPMTPTDPLNQLGVPGIGINSLSSVIHSSNTEFDYHYSAHPIEEWGNALLSRGYTPRVMVTSPEVYLEARGGKIPVPGAQSLDTTPEGLPRYRTLDLGWNPTLQRRMNADEGGPHGPGAPEARGDFYPLKPGMHAELRAIEPLLKSAYISVPLKGSGPLHPHSLEGWVDMDDIAPHPNQTSPFDPKF